MSLLGLWYGFLTLEDITRKSNLMKKIFIRPGKMALLYTLATVFFLTSGIRQARAQQTTASSTTPFLLLSFTGQTAPDINELSWTMEDETNAQYFVIERSADGNDFDSIGMVQALNNQEQLSYSFTDNHILSGYSYYRLRELDQMGVSRYSKIIILKNTPVSSGSSAGLQVYPNPAVSLLNYTIISPSADEVTVQVYTLSGVMISTQQFQIPTGGAQHSLIVSNLRSGNYFLHISSKQGANYTQTFSKI